MTKVSQDTILKLSHKQRFKPDKCDESQSRYMHVYRRNGLRLCKNYSATLVHLSMLIFNIPIVIFGP